MDAALEGIYQEHHKKRRGDFFLVNGDERGAFLRENVGKGKRVLDIGCRDGALTRFYAPGNTVTGADIDSAALARARETLGIEVRHVDLNGDWQLREQFDAVVACEIIEHLYYPDQVLRKILAALRPGGVLLGSIPHAFSLQSRLRYLLARKKNTPVSDPTHINHFTAHEFHALLVQAGYANIRIETIVSAKFKPLSALFPYTFAHSLMFSAEKP